MNFRRLCLNCIHFLGFVVYRILLYYLLILCLKCFIYIVVSWNFQTLGDAAAENASAVDAINYFSEMQLQSEIEKAKARKYSLKRSDGEDEKARNTVLILPAIDT